VLDLGCEIAADSSPQKTAALLIVQTLIPGSNCSGGLRKQLLRHADYYEPKNSGPTTR
jgi:hypothetical protein